MLLAFYLGAALAGVVSSASPYASITSAQWAALNTSVNGRLSVAIPIAQPCFQSYDLAADLDFAPDPAACAEVQAGWTDSAYRVQRFAAYDATFSERYLGQDCDLDYLNTTNPAATSGTCYQGSVPPYYINVSTADEVKAAFVFANQTGIPLVVKNTGHDFLGRSSGPESLGVWTKNILHQSIEEDFVPEGCSTSVGRAMTNGAGISWIKAYEFADENNGTVVGGGFTTVGASGGWLLGGGHGFLTGKDGLGVDSVLQFKVVTPDGEERVANACQNQDLFWALRGGGGAFAVVLESTIAVHPAYDVKVLNVQVSNISIEAQFDLFRVFGGLREQLGRDGWAGIFIPESAPEELFITVINPILTDEEAAASVAPFVEAVASLNGTDGINVVRNGLQPGGSYLFVHRTYIGTIAVGLGNLIGSRLVPVSHFSSAGGIDEITNSFKEAHERAGGNSWIQILMDTPLLTPDEGRNTSVNPVWRETAFELVLGVYYNWDTDAEQEFAIMDDIHEGLNVVRAVTPDGGAYYNEAEILEPDWQHNFWGDNYDKLLEIKRKYDPYNVLTGWKYVGFDEGDPRFDRFRL